MTLKFSYYYSGDYDINNFYCLKSLIEKANVDILAISFMKFLFIEEFSINKVEQFFLNNNNIVALYSDYYDISNDKCELIKLQKYSKGSVRDQFDFGKVFFININHAKTALKYINNDLKYCSFYALTLQLSLLGEICYIPEPIYQVTNTNEQSFEKQNFAYVDPKNRQYQIEAENVFTQYLKQIGAWIAPIEKTVDDFDNQVKQFKNLVSVIIPVKNRETTIATAINSAINQNVDFLYNIIVVDNHSTDNTPIIIDKLREKYGDKIIHIIPQTKTLGIGGCWNLAIHNKNCGAFAIQLDSDDGYSDNNVLQKIADTFLQEKCAMIIGSYQLTDADFKPLPTAIIDHKEYTKENGHNNALRVNGLGAPRCFFTPIIRSINFPNISYGEDYAVALRISSKYRIVRIFDVLYNCRRWSGNSDAAPTRATQNINNATKDFFRENEINYRRNLK
ncbi:MAG: glycosyltransferase [Bacteroidales bacterium]|nr:glycosyltransferase [Bacteroidales bacterium]